MKTAIVTGGGTGIGLAIARALAGEEFRVGLIGRRADALEAAADEIQRAGGQSWWAAVDVRIARDVTQFVESAVARFGSVQLLVNNAGMFEMRRFEDTDPEFWDAMLEVNLTGPYNCVRAVWPHIAGGQIINIGSVAGVKAFEGNAAYGAAKHGLIGLSEVLALEGRARDIRVHVVCPGNTDTELWAGKAPAEVRAGMLRPDWVAEVVRWLAVSPREVQLGQLVVTPARDPWKKP